MTAPIRDMAGLVRGLVHAREERQITNENIDEIAGLALRYTTKVLTGRKGLGPGSFEGILGALGKCLILVDDPEAIARVKKRWQRRKRIHSRALLQASASSIDLAEQEMRDFIAKTALSERMKALGQIGGKKGGYNGGKRRAKMLGKRARQRIASHAARARWARVKAAKSKRKRRSPARPG